MAHRSQPKNHPMIPERGNRPGHVVPHGNDGKYAKPHPGYPGRGPPMPGPAGNLVFIHFRILFLINKWHKSTIDP